MNGDKPCHLNSITSEYVMKYPCTSTDQNTPVLFQSHELRSGLKKKTKKKNEKNASKPVNAEV